MEIQKRRNRADKTETGDDREGDADGGRLKEQHFDANGSEDGEAMAARPSSQFKRSGVGGRLIITPAVNI